MRRPKTFAVSGSVIIPGRRRHIIGAEIVFHLWTSAAFPACADVTRPVFAYAGNPDHYSMAARLKHPDLFDIPQETLRNRTKLALWRRALGLRVEPYA